MPVYRLLENKTVERKRSGRRAGNKTGSEALPVERSCSREPDRERNGLIDALGTRTRSAALQTIKNAAEPEIGPTFAPSIFHFYIIEHIKLLIALARDIDTEYEATV